MKKVILYIFFVAANFCSIAQNGSEYNRGFTLSGGITLAVPSSNLPLWSVGLGADLLAQYALTEKFALTGDAGYTNLFGRKDIKSYHIVPVRIGAKYFTNRLYFAAKAGIGFLKVKDIDGATAVAYSLGGGYMLNKKTDLGLAYDGYSKNGTIGLIAVRIGFFLINN